MSGEAERAGLLEERADTITAEFVQLILGLTSALKDAERERERLRDAYHKLASAYTAVCHGSPHATQLRIEAGELYAQAALHESVPQGAEAGG